jgi:hypothetical protein
MCQEAPETFLSLLSNAAHWEFEIFLMLLIDGLILGIAMPILKRRWTAHNEQHKCACEPECACGPETQSPGGNHG